MNAERSMHFTFSLFRVRCADGFSLSSSCFLDRLVRFPATDFASFQSSHISFRSSFMVSCHVFFHGLPLIFFSLSGAEYTDSLTVLPATLEQHTSVCQPDLTLDSFYTENWERILFAGVTSAWWLLLLGGVYKFPYLLSHLLVTGVSFSTMKPGAACR